MISDKKSILARIFLYISFFYLSYIIVLNGIVFVNYGLFAYLLLFIIISIIIYIIAAFIKTKDLVFIIILFLTSFLLKAIIGAIANTTPISDFALFYEAGKAVAKGDFSFSDSAYFQNWAYQTGTVLYYAGLIKLFGSGLMPLILANCACISGVNVFIYLFIKRYTQEKHARFIALLYMIYPATFFLASVLTNQHISNLLIIAGVYLFTSQIRFNGLQFSPSRTIFSGVLIAFGNAIRPQGIIVIAAIFILGIVELSLYLKEKKVVVNLVKSISIIILVYFMIGLSLSSLISITGINKYGLSDNCPLWKFVVGLNYETCGTYSNEDVTLIFSIKDRNERNRVSKEVILHRISDPVKLIKLIGNKNYIMWAKEDTLDWAFGRFYEKNIDISGFRMTFSSFEQKVLKLERVFYLAGFFMLLLGLYSVLKHKEDNKSYNLLMLILMAYFGIHIFIEIQPRYRDFAMIFVFILSAQGFEYFMLKITKKTSDTSLSYLYQKYKHLLRFIVTGVLNTLVDILTFYILNRFLSVHYSVSQAAAYAAGSLNSFIMNKLWTFGDRDVNKRIFLQILKFIIVNLLSLGISELGLKTLIEIAGINVYISKILIIIPTWTVNFLGYKLWVFKLHSAGGEKG
jgi:putative flippase GtrA